MFLAVGFHRPHIPYVYPRAFEFRGDVEFPPANYYVPRNTVPCSQHDWTFEGMRYADLANLRPSITAGHATTAQYQANLSALCGAAPLAVQRAMRRAYLSSIQFVDFLTGVLFDALRRRGLYESATIVFWGDHGYKTGEHCSWFKHDNSEASTRIPLLLKPAAAALTGVQRGAEVGQLVEEIDLFPSLAELAGLRAPTALEGTSFVPLLSKRGGGKAAAFSQYPRLDAARNVSAMGYSLRTPEWRYTAWAAFACDLAAPMANCSAASAASPRWGALLAAELYDHRGDMSDEFAKYENVNLAGRPEYAVVERELQRQLVASWAPPRF
jgi:iduronate 2-sulfatase